jgi:hypothetical protein
MAPQINNKDQRAENNVFLERKGTNRKMVADQIRHDM